MVLFQYILLGFLVVCAISVSFSKKLLNSILIFMSYSLIMSIIWVCLEAPDLAITEAAVGAGVTSVLFFVTLKKIEAIGDKKKKTEGAESDDALITVNEAAKDAAEQDPETEDRQEAVLRTETAADCGEEKK